MPAYSVRVVRRPRSPRRCSECEAEITGPHLVLFGCAFKGDPPYQIRLCADCALKDHGPCREPRVAEGVAKLRALLEEET